MATGHVWRPSAAVHVCNSDVGKCFLSSAYLLQGKGASTIILLQLRKLEHDRKDHSKASRYQAEVSLLPPSLSLFNFSCLPLCRSGGWGI